MSTLMLKLLILETFLHTPFVPQYVSHFDCTRVLVNVIESEMKKLVDRWSYFYILIL